MWLVEVSADIRLGSSGINVVDLLVDGAVYSPSGLNTAGPSGLRIAGAKTWRVSSLAAGSHTFSAQAYSAGAYTTQVFHPHTLITSHRVA